MTVDGTSVKALGDTQSIQCGQKAGIMETSSYTHLFMGQS